MLVDLWTYRNRPPRVAEIVLLLGPDDRMLVKRVSSPRNRGRSVPAGSVWIVGDHPAASEDSREFGPVPRHRIRGRVFWRYWPLSRAGPVR